MTIKELSQLYYLNREIEQLKKQKYNLEFVLQQLSHTKDAVQGSSKEFPFVLHNIPIEGIGACKGTEWLKCKSELEDVKRLLNLKIRQVVLEYNRLNRYIEGIEDSLTRQIFTARFVEGMRWERVADCVGGVTAGAAKMICARYLQSH